MNSSIRKGKVQVLICLGLVFAAFGSSRASSTEEANSAWTLVHEQMDKVQKQKDKGGAGEYRTQVLAAAKAAEQFHQKYPNHAKAGEARRFEARQRLAVADPGNWPEYANALQLMRAYRSDQSEPIEARLGIALTMEHREFKRRGLDRLTEKGIREYMAVGDKLRVEFGDEPAVHGWYLWVAEGAGESMGREILDAVLRMPLLPTDRSRANNLKEQYSLLGKKMDMKLTGLDGTRVDLNKGARGRPIVLVFINQADKLPALEGLTEGASAQVYYVAAHGAAAANERTAKNVYVEKGGASGDLHRTFKIRKAPYICILDGDGTVLGIGPQVRSSQLLGLLK